MGPWRRSGSILVAVIAVMALIFIIAATLLIVAHLYRSSAHTAAESETIRAGGEALLNGVLTQLREDVVGRDGVPYNGR